MKPRSWTFVDKSSWPRGPWDSEPDKEQWEDSATGLPCLIVRGPVGALCGYVGVPEGHPACGEIEDLSVHGGVSYGPAPCVESEHGICHVPEPSEPDHVFWIGFDCAHYGDLAPASRFFSEGVYRGVSYVKEECTRLAEQIRDLG